MDTTTAFRIIIRVKEVGAKRIVFTGGDPVKRPDIGGLIRQAKRVGLEVALSTSGDELTQEILEDIKPYVPDFDHYGEVRTGWLEEAGKSVSERRADERFT